MKIALIGAGGKMGMRIAANLRKTSHEVSYIEVSDAGIERLQNVGIQISAFEPSVQDAEVVILAVPDRALGTVSAQTTSLMQPGAMLFTLDPAAAMAGKLTDRADLAYFVAHPSHPSIFNWEPTLEAQRDYFGGILAHQTVVCALMKGKEADYVKGEEVACAIYAPVRKAFRITVEQMALLEPALVETLCSTLQVIVKEGLDEVIRRGVPAEAAREFLLGHLNIQLAVIYNQLPGAVFSDAANKAIERGRPVLIKDDWKKVFEPDNVMQQINEIIQ